MAHVLYARQEETLKRENDLNADLTLFLTSILVNTYVKEPRYSLYTTSVRVYFHTA